MAEPTKKHYLNLLVQILNKAKLDYRKVRDAKNTGQLFEALGLTFAEFRYLVLLDIQNMVNEGWLKRALAALDVEIDDAAWKRFLQSDDLLDGFMGIEAAQKQLSTRAFNELEKVYLGKQALVSKESVEFGREGDAFDKLLRRHYTVDKI